MNAAIENLNRAIGKNIINITIIHIKKNYMYFILIIKNNRNFIKNWIR